MIAPLTAADYSLKPGSQDAPAGGILVGVDGSTESIAALNTAAALARSRRCSLHAVSVLRPYPSHQDMHNWDTTTETIDQLRKSLRESELGEIVRALEPAYNWTHEVVIGKPARELVSIAHRCGAAIIVVGRRKHTHMDRALHGETALQLMRVSPLPVLAVEAEIQTVRTAVVGTDFSPSSSRAARIALEFIRASGKGTLYLAIVEPSAELGVNEFMMSSETRFPGDSDIWFRRLTASLGPHQGIRVEPTILGGAAVPSLIDFANQVRADMVAVGSHSRGRLERLLLGSVSTGLVQDSDCPVLVVPPAV